MSYKIFGLPLIVFILVAIVVVIGIIFLTKPTPVNDTKVYTTTTTPDSLTTSNKQTGGYRSVWKHMI